VGVALFFAALSLSVPARADCTVDPNGTTILTPQTRPEGAIFYNVDAELFQTCRNGNWLPLRITGGGYNTLCNAIGDVCADGSVYVGNSPLDGAALYATRCDLGRAWNGTACEGEPTRDCWDDCSGNATVTDIYSAYDGYDGHFNTAALSVMDMNGSSGGVQTSQLINDCRNLSIHGHGDWYLPARYEMQQMRDYHTLIGDFDRTGYPYAYYPISSEYDQWSAEAFFFSNGGGYDGLPKEYNGSMLGRCIRKAASGSETAPTGCATAGNSCSDGTKYAGDHPYLAGVKMYVTTADQSNGVTWGATGNTGADSYINGYANTAWLAHNATIGSYPAAQLCEELTASGHGDWYLPSEYELGVLYTNRAAIGGFGTGNYWSSTEATSGNARRKSFNTGSSSSTSKGTSYSVRCVRKDNFD
jgi:hypothetical protein